MVVKVMVAWGGCAVLATETKVLEVMETGWGKAWGSAQLARAARELPAVTACLVEGR